MPAASVSRGGRVFIAAMKTIAAVMLAVTVASAQQNNAPAADKFSATTRMVMVDVVVKDGDGNRINSLTANDFQLTEDGKPQVVTLVDVKTLPGVEDNVATEPDVFTNVPPANTSRGPALILLLDALNTRFADQYFIRKAMLDFVAKHASPGQPMAVFVLNNGLSLVQDFTTDPSTLLQAIPLVNGTSPLMPASSSDTALNVPASFQIMVSGLESFAEGMMAEQRGKITKAAMKSIAEYARAVPGRKALVWFSDGFPVWVPSASQVTALNARIERANAGSADTGDAERPGRPHPAEEIVNILCDAQIALYPADAHGLVVFAPTDFDQPARFGGGGPYSIRSMSSGLMAGNLELRHMAEATGGRALLNRNDLETAIERAAQDNRASYLLAYYPTNKKYDGKFRQIKIRVPGHAAKVQHRSGYFGTATPADSVRGEFREEVLAGNPHRGVLFHARVGPEQDGHRKVDFFVHGASLGTVANTGQFDLTVQVLTLSVGRKKVMLGERAVHTQLTPAQRAATATSGILYSMDVPVSQEITRLRLAVRDNVTGKYGVIEAPVGLLVLRRQP